ncbi:MAG: type II toxin-antitoxin system RelE/ParE family toxin [Candidatus Pacebacteria bacterium]|nr:type II toxin-antitoxin system RelE/ParE family toxin [Candidatus Paceibacterota bacterium]
MLELKYEIFFEPVVISEDLKLIGKKDKERIKKAINVKITSHPDLYSLPLRRPLDGYRKLRVGKYRIIFKLNEKKKICLIIGIRHRENIYSITEKRLN